MARPSAKLKVAVGTDSADSDAGGRPAAAGLQVAGAGHSAAGPGAGDITVHLSILAFQLQ